MAKRGKRDISTEHRKPYQFRFSNQEIQELDRAASLDDIKRAAVVRGGALVQARAIIKRHQARGT